jgi:hypothetical protein
VPVAVCLGILMVILPSAQWSHLPWFQLMAEAWPKGWCFFRVFSYESLIIKLLLHQIFLLLSLKMLYVCINRWLVASWVESDIEARRIICVVCNTCVSRYWGRSILVERCTYFTRFNMLHNMLQYVKRLWIWCLNSCML